MTKRNIKRDILQGFIVDTLNKRGFSSVITHKRNSREDIICQNPQNLKKVYLKVKAYKPSSHSCIVSPKGEIYYGEDFFWVLGEVSTNVSEKILRVYIIPSKIMSENQKETHELWLKTPGKYGQPHVDTNIRIVFIPPHKPQYSWDISEFLNRWDLLVDNLS